MSVFVSRFGSGHEVQSAVADQVVFFTEGFDDSNWGSRGWYDGSAGAVDTIVHPPSGGGAASLNFHWNLGATTPTIQGPRRKLFTPSPTVYLSYWLKLGTAGVTWQGSGAAFHPHFIRLFSDDDDPFGPPNYPLLEVMVEMSVFTPRMVGDDGKSINIPQVGVDLLTSATDHAVFGGNGDQNASATHYQIDPDPEWYNGTFFDAASPVYVNNTWHRVEVYWAMNSVVGGIPQADGVMQHWVDGNIVIDLHNVYIRSGNHPNRKFNQLAILPFIGPGSPIAQDMWMDSLTVADRRVP